MIQEKAFELGRLVGQSEEFQAFKRANERLKDEPELKVQLEQLRSLQLKVAEQLDRGVAPTPEQQSEIDRLIGTVQSHPAYQVLVAAQMNYDKLMVRINDWIGDGIARGAESRIITLG